MAKQTNGIWCIARHHSIPTRLLDWTYSPLIAAYFATKEETSKDPVIYCLNIVGLNEIDETTSPFEIKNNIVAFDAGTLTSRIANQSSIFTVHKNPLEPLENLPMAKDNLKTIIIKNSYRDKFLRELSFYNLHEETLFPGLDGLGRRVRWQLARMYNDHKKSGKIK